MDASFASFLDVNRLTWLIGLDTIVSISSSSSDSLIVSLSIEIRREGLTSIISLRTKSPLSSSLEETGESSEKNVWGFNSLDHDIIIILPSWWELKESNLDVSLVQNGASVSRFNIIIDDGSLNFTVIEYAGYSSGKFLLDSEFRLFFNFLQNSIVWFYILQ